MSDASEYVGAQLRAAVDHAGLLQVDLALLMGVSVGRVSQILSGRENLTIETVDAVLSQCGVRLTLVPFAEFNPRPPSEGTP